MPDSQKSQKNENGDKVIKIGKQITGNFEKSSFSHLNDAVLHLNLIKNRSKKEHNCF